MTRISIIIFAMFIVSPFTLQSVSSQSPGGRTHQQQQSGRSGRKPLRQTESPVVLLGPVQSLVQSNPQAPVEAESEYDYEYFDEEDGLQKCKKLLLTGTGSPNAARLLASPSAADEGQILRAFLVKIFQPLHDHTFYLLQRPHASLLYVDVDDLQKLCGYAHDPSRF